LGALQRYNIEVVDLIRINRGNLCAIAEVRLSDSLSINLKVKKVKSKPSYVYWPSFVAPINNRQQYFPFIALPDALKLNINRLILGALNEQP